MSQERPVFKEQPTKVVRVMPFIGLTDAEMDSDGFSESTKFELQRIPGLNIEHNIFLKPENESDLDDVFPKTFSYSRYVDKEGTLHYWKIEIAPHLEGESAEEVADLLRDEPDYESRKKLVESLKRNLPHITITPDNGINMLVAGTYQLTLNKDIFCKKNLVSGKEIKLTNRPVSIEDLVHYEESISANIESKVFDDDRAYSTILDVLASIKYASIGIDAIMKKLQMRMEFNSLSEEELRSLVNIKIDVCNTEIDRDDMDQVAA